MKKLNLLVTAVLAFVILSCAKKESVETTTPSEPQPSAPVEVTTACVKDSSAVSAETVFPIAYVDVDSLLQRYDLAKKLNESLIKNEERKRKELTSAQNKLAAELEVAQQKYQSGGFLSSESLQQEQERLMKKEQELQQMSQRLTQELLNEQQKFTKQVRDSINAFIKIYNADGRYKMILINYDNVLYAEKSLNITNDVVEQMNERYKNSKKK